MREGPPRDHLSVADLVSCTRTTGTPLPPTTPVPLIAFVERTTEDLFLLSLNPLWICEIDSSADISRLGSKTTHHLPSRYLKSAVQWSSPTPTASIKRVFTYTPSSSLIVWGTLHLQLGVSMLYRSDCHCFLVRIATQAGSYWCRV